MNRVTHACDRIIEIGLILLVSVIPLIIDPGGFNPVLIKTTFTHIIIFTIFLAWLVRSLKESRFQLIRTTLNFPLLLFFFSSIISFLFSKYKFASVRGLFDFFCYIVLVFVIVNNVRNTGSARKIIMIFLISSAVASFYGLLQHFGIDFIPWIRGGKVISTMGGSNFFAGYLIIIIPVCLGVFFMSRSLVGKILCSALLLSFGLCLIWTFTRSSWLALFSGLLLFSILKIQRTGMKNIIKRSNLAGIGIFFVLLISMILIVRGAGDFKLFRSRVQSIVPSAIDTMKEIPHMVLKPYQFQTKISESPGARITIWQGAYRMFLNRPVFGHGVGTLEVSFPQFRPSFYRYKLGDVHTILHAHSEYLEILSEQGIPGLIMFLWLLFAFFASTFGKLKKIDEQSFNLGIGCLSAIFAILVEGLISVNLRWTSPALFFWLLIGLTIVIGNQQTGQAEPQVLKSGIIMSFNKRAKLLIFILLFSTGIFFWTNEINLFNSNLHLGRALKFAQVYKRPDISILECEESLKWEPTNIRTLYFSGMCYSMQGQWQQAKNAFLKVERLAPHYHQVDYSLGVAYHSLGMTKQSLKYLKKAMELDMSNMEALKIINSLDKGEK